MNKNEGDTTLSAIESIGLANGRNPLIHSLLRFTSKVIGKLNPKGIKEQIDHIRKVGPYRYAKYLDSFLTRSMGEPTQKKPEAYPFMDCIYMHWAESSSISANTLYQAVIFPGYIKVGIEMGLGTMNLGDGTYGSMIACASTNWSESEGNIPLNGGKIGDSHYELSSQVVMNKDGLAGAIHLSNGQLKVINHDDLIEIAQNNFSGVAEADSVIPTTLVIDSNNIPKVLNAKHLIRGSIGARLLEYNFIGEVYYHDGTRRVIVLTSERDVHIKYICDCIEGIKYTDPNISGIKLALTEQTRGRFSPHGEFANSVGKIIKGVQPFYTAYRPHLVFSKTQTS